MRTNYLLKLLIARFLFYVFYFMLGVNFSRANLDLDL